MTADELGYVGIAITDLNSLAGIVRAHVAAKDLATQFIVGCAISIAYDPDSPASEINLEELGAGKLKLPKVELLAYPTSRKGYANLCSLLTVGKLRSKSGECILAIADLATFHADLALIIVPPHCRSHYYRQHLYGGREPGYSVEQYNLTGFIGTAIDITSDKERLSLAITEGYLINNSSFSQQIIQIGHSMGIKLVATNDVYYHSPKRKPLQDVLTAIREQSTVEECGLMLFENSERYLKPLQKIAHIYRDIPEAITRTIEVAQHARGFSLSSLKYEYPQEILPDNKDPQTYLSELAWEGASKRYPSGIPTKVSTLIAEELSLIHELQYAQYFLTCYDIVKHARSLGILCQGRGAAANSAVCYCLEITSVDPLQIDLLFARFVSKERNEPPDIDIDFEHERREEVIQYIYQKYGRHRAGLTAEVVTFRQRSAIREVAKALGFSPEIVDRLAKSIHRWNRNKIDDPSLIEIGLSPQDPMVTLLFNLFEELIGFPRHLSQHVGGFIICKHALSESVPILNASMDGRTIIEWDKDDIEALGMLKIDILGLGMLSCIRRAFAYIQVSTNQRQELYSVPPEDPAVYEMICAADTVGVFQIESRAQMSMLPRLKPRCFYDLVIEVAIVRPGPIQGNMVHPYLRRRSGLEKASYPDERVREVLGKTLGVPLFQEQAMRLVIVMANFSPGEAEQLRRAMQAWKRNKGLIATFRERIINGMVANGYTAEFADVCVNQIRGFGEYGFPESHAASFALIVYVSAWIKCHYPVHFAAALINSQPMGFYAPAQIVADLKAHDKATLPIDINYSSWECTIENLESQYALRLGAALIAGINSEQFAIIEQLRQNGLFVSIRELWQRAEQFHRYFGAKCLRKSTLIALAKADAFRSLGLSTREALWEIRSLPTEIATIAGVPPLKATATCGPQESAELPNRSLQQSMFDDFKATGLSLKAHPLQFLREYLRARAGNTAAELRASKSARKIVSTAGIATFRQRPSTAKGVVFITLEDETGVSNLIIRPQEYERYKNIILSSSIIFATGILDKIGPVVYISADRLESLDQLALAGPNNAESSSSPHTQSDLQAIPSRSYSY